MSGQDGGVLLQGAEAFDGVGVEFLDLHSFQLTYFLSFFLIFLARVLKGRGGGMK